MRLINLTPHEVVILVGGKPLRLAPSGRVARLEVAESEAGVDGIPVVRTQFGEITGLPDPEPETFFVTSTIVAQAAARLGRRDVVAPDTGPTAIRNEKGQVIAVRRLQCF